MAIRSGSALRAESAASKKELREFSEGKINTLHPVNYGVEDGLRSAQLSFGYLAAGGARTSDGRIWFPTTRGLAVIDPKRDRRAAAPLTVLPVELAIESKAGAAHVPPGQALPPGSERTRLRYSAIHLSDPNRVQYFHALGGLDPDWVPAGHGREINYNSLPHGSYQFRVRAVLPDGVSAENHYDFEVLPKFYETIWFRALMTVFAVGGIWGAYQFRLRRLHQLYTAVMEERTRLAGAGLCGYFFAVERRGDGAAG